MPEPGSFVVVSSGTCESAGLVTITDESFCLAGLRGVTADPTKEFASGMPAGGHTDSGTGRAFGCTLNSAHGAANIYGEFWPQAQGPCGVNSYDCICAPRPNRYPRCASSA